MEANQAQTGYLTGKLSLQASATQLSVQKIRERIIEFAMFLCALSSIAITVGIVGILLSESWSFFKTVSIVDFLTDTQWTV